MSLVVTLLLSSVAYTFSYKSRHYGDVTLPYALQNAFTKNSLYLLYSLREGSRNLWAGAFAAVQPNDEEDGRDERMARAIPVLVYHSVDDRGGYSVSPTRFLEHMEALRDAGWQTITLADFEAFANGEKELPERSFLLTFDDGAKMSYYTVDPVLNTLDYNAVSFILPKYSVGGGTHYYLSSGEVRRMLQSGRWEIGSHGQDTHEFAAINAEGDLGAKLANFIWLPDVGRAETAEEFKARVQEDLSVSKSNLEKEFGVPIEAFAFPFGEFGQLTKDYTLAMSHDIEEVTRGVYRLAFYQTWEGEGFTFNYKNRDGQKSFMIKRIEPKPETSPEDLVKKLEEGLPKNLPFKDGFDSDQGWFSTWGETMISDSALSLEAGSTQTGAAAVLDGTRDWQDYRARLTLETDSGSGFVVMARFQDGENFAGCNFGTGFMHAEETLEGERRVIKGKRAGSITIPTDRSFTVDVIVEGRTIKCISEDGTTVETTFLDESLNTGGLGVKVWNPAVNVADLRVLDAEITPIDYEPEKSDS